MAADQRPALRHEGSGDRAWFRIARALLVGFALGLVVHMMFSMLLVQLGAQGSGGSHEPRTGVQCRKQNPARQPASARPSTSVTPS